MIQSTSRYLGLFLACAAFAFFTPSVGGQTVVIPLHGQVGHLLNADEFNVASFDSAYFEHSLKKAQAKGATTIVLHIDSRSGYAYERNAICDLINDWRDKMDFIAYVERATGAAATIALSCERIIAGPSCMLGVGLSLDAESGNAVNERRIQTEAATIRSYIQQAGRDGQIADALAIEELQLWWHPEYGFSIPTTTNRSSTDSATESTETGSASFAGRTVLRDRLGNVVAALDSRGGIVWESNRSSVSTSTTDSFTNEGSLNETNWMKIDGEFSLLTLTGHDAIKVGLIETQARSIEACLDAIPIESIDIESDLRRIAKRRQSKAIRAIRQFQQFVENLSLLNERQRDMTTASKKSKNKMRKRLMDSMFSMIKISRSLLKIAESPKRLLSISPVELCQLRETGKYLKKAHDHLRKYEYGKAANDLASVHKQWKACQSVM